MALATLTRDPQGDRLEASVERNRAVIPPREAAIDKLPPVTLSTQGEQISNEGYVLLRIGRHDILEKP
jgi:hypothetical protein